MKIIFIRHGNPDYQLDCLTELGHRQAEAAAETLCTMGIEKIFASTHGRAMETAEHTAKKTIKPDAMSAVNVELLTLSVSNADGEIDFFAGFAGIFGSRESVCRVAIPRISVAMSTDRYRRSPFLRLCSIPLPTVEQKKTKDG